MAGVRSAAVGADAIEGMAMHRIQGIGPRARATAMLAVAAWLAWIPARAASPFAIVPTVSTNAGRIWIALGFDVPAAHLIYAEKLEFRIEGRTNLLRFKLPQPVHAKDPFTGQMKHVYPAGFTADWVLPKSHPEPVRITVTFQGCSGSSCFFPESRRFEFDSHGVAREVNAAGDDCRPPFLFGGQTGTGWDPKTPRRGDGPPHERKEGTR